MFNLQGEALFASLARGEHPIPHAAECSLKCNPLR